MAVKGARLRRERFGERPIEPRRGSLSSINLLIWPALYGYVGWLWGAQHGWLAIAVIAAAVVAGVAVGVFMANINPYVVPPIVAWLALILPWFLEAETWRWTALGLCAAPLPVIALGLFLRKTWV